MINDLVLSIFPGIDMFGRAFEEEGGFCVVRGPDLLWGGDIKNFHPPSGVFQGVIGGPPCIGESSWANLNANKGFTLWPEAMRVIEEAKPNWWVLEAVKRHNSPYAVKLSPRYFQEKQSRHRWFHSNINLEPYIQISLFEHPQKEPCVTASERAKGLRIYSVKNKRYLRARDFSTICELQGLPRDFDIPCFTSAGKGLVVGNGVPLSMGQAIAKAIKEINMKKDKANKLELKEGEFENLLDKASQPLEQEQKLDSKEAGTSESPTSGDCSETHTHSDSPEGT